MRFKLIPFLLLPLLPFISFTTGADMKPARILHTMFDSIRNIKTLRVKISALERVGTTYSSASSEIKLQSQPRKLYFLNRQRKLEILFDSENMGTKALVKLHSFPYLSLSLDPNGNLMRKNQHYTINELGYEFIGKSIAQTINKDSEGINNFKLLGKVLKNGSPCYLLEYENKAYGYVDYKVGSNESIVIIAAKFGVNDYLVHYKNNLFNEFGYLKAGSIIKVPNLYCKKAVLYIDEKRFLPISISLYDDVGLFESYDFSSLELNRGIHPSEFKKDYKDYGF